VAWPGPLGRNIWAYSNPGSTGRSLGHAEPPIRGSAAAAKHVLRSAGKCLGRCAPAGSRSEAKFLVSCYPHWNMRSCSRGGAGAAREPCFRAGRGRGFRCPRTCLQVRRVRSPGAGQRILGPDQMAALRRLSNRGACSNPLKLTAGPADNSFVEVIDRCGKDAASSQGEEGLRGSPEPQRISKP
jgi:hypothetical protein